MPAMGRPSGRPGTPRVVPSTPELLTTVGSTSRGTPSSVSISSDQASVLRSSSSVREALLTSVAWTAPPVSRHTRKVSTVPNASSPRAARGRRPDTWPSSHSSLVPEKYGSSVSPVSSRTRASRPSALSWAHRSAVRRSCHTMALCRALPLARSHNIDVSRWLVMPMALMSRPATPLVASALRSAAVTEPQMSSGSCSTQPGCG